MLIKWCWLNTEDKKIIEEMIKKKKDETCHWPIIIEDDVRIWTWAKIMSWVRIWQWAIIAAWAIVTKNVPPYAIVWWIPAKIIKYRFSNDKIKKLLKIPFSDICIKDLSNIYKETITSDFNTEFILNHFWVK